MIIKALLWEKLEGTTVKCLLCAHGCRINDGAFGFCGMRKNEGGELFTYAYGSVIANHVDPIEKKPLYHFLPGTYSYSVATVGCNFRCSFCQNWTISQASASLGNAEGNEMKPEEIVREALRSGCSSISYTYTEPTIFFEYALDTAKISKKNGLYNVFVTNGFMTPEAMNAASGSLDAANIDLKFFSEESYKSVCRGRLRPVLDCIINMKNMGIWVEVTTLVVPGLNDSMTELEGIAKFLASVSRDLPWHISRFHPDYKLTEVAPTPLKTLDKAFEAGKKAGLKYVYLGNVAADSDTMCPLCGEKLIERAGFSAKILPAFSGNGLCSKCGTLIEGVWSGAAKKEGVV